MSGVVEENLGEGRGGNETTESEHIAIIARAEQFHRSLWQVLLPSKSAWMLRQACGYDGLGVVLAGYSEPTPEQMEFINKVIQGVGNRLLYVEKAYHFPDNLLALICLLQMNGDIQQFKEGVALLGRELRQFVESELSEAFDVEIDFEHLTYSIIDIEIDPTTLLDEWREFEDSLGIES